MATSYYATRLSENIGETPEGFRVCMNVVVGRTGFQAYTIGSLNQEAAKRLGIDTSNPSAEIELFRPAEEVFAARTLSSFEGKPVTLDHPPEFVNPDTFRTYARGHATKIRKGDEVLEDGNWPLMADLIITDAELIREIDAGRRELSCGYQYELDSDGHGQFLQTNIIGNHIAVVDYARAGAEARIYDSAAKRSETEVKPPVEEVVQVKPVGRQFISKEKKQMKPKQWYQRLLGLGFQQMAKDEQTSPEDLAAAAASVKAFDSDENEEEKDKKAKDAEEEKRREGDRKAKDAKDAADKAAKDAEEAERKKKDEEDRKAKDAAEKEGMHHQPCGVKDCQERDCRMHGALDSILKAHPAEKGEDADMKELGELLGDFMKEEGAEPTEQGDEPDFIEPEMDKAEPELVEHDAQSGRSRAGDAIDSFRDNRADRQREKERAELRTMAPEIARSGDSKKIADYNNRVRRLRASGSSGGYDKFARASAATEGLPSGSPAGIDAHNQAYEKMCADERNRPLNGKGGK